MKERRFVHLKDAPIAAHDASVGPRHSLNGKKQMDQTLKRIPADVSALASSLARTPERTNIPADFGRDLKNPNLESDSISYVRFAVQKVGGKAGG
jgi:hypothetical protein